jgi:hypothetical protein
MRLWRHRVPDLPAADPVQTSNPSRRRRSKAAFIAILVSALGAGAALLAIALLIGRAAADAQVGDCLPQSVTADDMKTVDCADADAAYKVVAVIDGTAGQAQANDETHPCARFADATTSLWRGDGDHSQPAASDRGKILCLAPAK